MASLLTSTFPVAHRAYAVSSTVPAGLPTLPAWLRGEGYSTAGITSNVYFADRSGLERGFDTVRYFPDKDGELINGEFRRQLDLAGDGKHFTYLHYMDTHLPFTIHDDRLGEEHRRVVEKYGATTMRSIEDMGIVAAEVERLHDLYLHEVEYFDRLVGEVVEELKVRGLYDRTLIVLTADHGSEYGEHGSVYHGHTLYEESLRVPLCLKPAGAGPGKGMSVKTVVRHVDLFPTVADFLGLEPPPDLHGRSLLPVVEGKDGASGDSVVFAELLQFPSCHLEAVIRDGWKLIRRNKVSYRLILSQLWKNVAEGNWYIFRSVLRGAAKVVLKVVSQRRQRDTDLELYYLPDDHV